MRLMVKNEDYRPLDQTQPTSVNSSCHKGIVKFGFDIHPSF